MPVVSARPIAWKPKSTRRATIASRFLRHTRHRFEPGERLGHSHVDVGQVMALTRRQDRMDFVHAGIDGTLRSLVVGYQSRIDRAWPTLDTRHHLLGIPELWDHLRMHKGSHLYTGNPGRA